MNTHMLSILLTYMMFLPQFHDSQHSSLIKLQHYLSKLYMCMCVRQLFVVRIEFMLFLFGYKMWNPLSSKKKKKNMWNNTNSNL